jgi:diguanylate cyclase (GGDEF)-like protein
VTALIYAVGGLGLLSSAVFHTPGKNPRWVLATLGVLGLLFVVVALARGRRLRVAEAEAMLVVLVAAVPALTLGSHIDVAAFSNGMALPLIAVYAGWFLSRRGSALVYAGALAWVAAEASRGDDMFTSVAAMLVLEVVIGGEVARLIVDRMLRLMRTDALTGVLNRMALEEGAHRLLDEARRRDRPLSIAVIDVDDLRVVNNTRGHAAGDALLSTVARQWADGLSDVLLGRVGGDEFVVVLPGRTAERAEAELARLPREPRWSAGVAELRGTETFDELMERADQAMYREKGRAAATTRLEEGYPA